MENNLLTRIQNWHKVNCNGDWEHSHTISIETLSNPGWSVKIDLGLTSLENLEFERRIDNGTFDWLFIRVENGVFKASGDLSKLAEILKIFLDEVIPNYADETFHYQAYVPLIGPTIEAWRPVDAKMLTEDTFEIVEIPNITRHDIRIKNIDDFEFMTENVDSYTINYSVGDIIKIDLSEMYDGVTPIAIPNE